MSEDKKTTWKDHVGQFSDPEIGKAARAKSLETRRAKKAIREALKSSEYIFNAAAQVVAEDPEWLVKIIEMYKSITQDKAASPKDRMLAASQLTEILGTRVPKKTEVAVEKKEDMSETLQRLQQLGVTGVAQVEDKSDPEE